MGNCITLTKYEGTNRKIATLVNPMTWKIHITGNDRVVPNSSIKFD